MNSLKSYETILVADANAVRTITLNRPARRNALTPEMELELIDALESAEASDCRLLVLTGAGDAFCSGLDLTVLATMHEKSSAEHRASTAQVSRLFLTLHELPMPTIAAVHGPAIAGGTGLACICDFTLATPTAKFGFTEARIGFVPALVSAYVGQLVGYKLAADLLLAARIFSADEALRMGLVNEVVAADALADRVRSLAAALIANSPEALRATKQMLLAQNRDRLRAAIDIASEAGAKARSTPDFEEGVRAFLEKRQPVWAGKTS